MQECLRQDKRTQKSSDEVLRTLKINLFRRMYSHNMDKTTMRTLANFLKMYVHFSKPVSNHIFKSAINTINNINTTIVIAELIQHWAKQKGKAVVVRNLIVKMGLSYEQVAEIAEVEVTFFQQVRAAIKDKENGKRFLGSGDNIHGACSKGFF